MPVFHYKAHDRKTNKEVTDTIEASNQMEAIAAIKRLGLLPIEVRETKGKSGKSPTAGGKSHGGGFSIGGIKASHVTLFTRQLSTLQDAGLPVVQSLQILTDMQRPGKFKNALFQVTEDVQGGTMLSEAMSRHPKIWDRLYTNLVKAGETAGALDVILRRLAEFREKSQRLRKKVIGALIYPAAVMFIAVGILTFIMIVIVPRFQTIFKELAISLPLPTEILIDVSNFMASWWGLSVIIGFFLFIIGVRIAKATEVGANVIDRVTLRLPVFGNVIKKSSVARFTRTLGTLVTSGVGFLDALDITKAATPNVVVRNAVQAVRDSVKEGETINEPLRRSGVFDDIVVNMIKVGEETGELDKMLVKVADNYDEEVDAAVAAMMSLMEPMLIVFMGGAVGFIVIALFMPLIKIIETLGQQAGG
jgi:type IV pilus assembly protein PilC